MTAPLVAIDVVGLTRSLLAHAPNLSALADEGFCAAVDPILPAVTCSAQAPLFTGTLPRDHGIVGNGWYCRDLAEVWFWRQANQLVVGDKLWETARRERPDLILLDLALPQLSGTEVCRQLKEAPATADIPVLLLTGMAQQAKRDAAHATGAQGCIEKPFSPRTLTAQIAELLQEAPAAAAA